MRLPLGTLAWIVVFLAGCAASGRGGDLPGDPDGAVLPDGAAKHDSGEATDGAPPADGGGQTDAAPPADASPLCGDGVVQTNLGEQCDDGNSSSNDSCLNTCMTNVCGDGHIWIGVEECDDGNSSSGDGCTTGCVVEYCGDGVIQAGIGEQCEGGSQTCTASCGSLGTQTCQVATCTWTTCAPPAETCNAADDDCDGAIDTVSCLVDVWRFYNPGNGDHMVFTYISNADLPSVLPSWTREGCGRYVWDFN